MWVLHLLKSFKVSKTDPHKDGVKSSYLTDLESAAGFFRSYSIKHGAFLRNGTICIYSKISLNVYIDWKHTHTLFDEWIHRLHTDSYCSIKVPISFWRTVTHDSRSCLNLGCIRQSSSWTDVWGGPEQRVTEGNITKTKIIIDIMTSLTAVVWSFVKRRLKSCTISASSWVTSASYFVRISKASWKILQHHQVCFWLNNKSNSRASLWRKRYR